MLIRHVHAGFILNAKLSQPCSPHQFILEENVSHFGMVNIGAIIILLPKQTIDKIVFKVLKLNEMIVIDSGKGIDQ